MNSWFIISGYNNRISKHMGGRVLSKYAGLLIPWKKGEGVTAFHFPCSCKAIENGSMVVLRLTRIGVVFHSLGVEPFPKYIL